MLADAITVTECALCASAALPGKQTCAAHASEWSTMCSGCYVDTQGPLCKGCAPFASRTVERDDYDDVDLVARGVIGSDRARELAALGVVL